MKRYIVLILCCALGFSACDWLQEEPTTILTEVSIYESESTAQAALTGIYGQYLSTQYGSWGRFVVGANSVYMGGNKNTNSVGVSKNDVAPWKQCFSQMYSAINNCNTLVVNASNSSLDKDFVNHLTGEAKFLRAFIYFDLVRMYGRVPLVIDPPKSMDDAYSPRANVKDILNQIEADLKDAFNTMADKGEEMPGHPHKWAAKAMLTKVYCYMAGLQPEHLRISEDLYEENYTAAEQAGFWQKAYDCGKEVVESGKYDLVECFEDLFYNKPGSRNTVESIFEFQFNDSNPEIGHSITGRQLTKTSEYCPYNGTGNWGSAGVTRTTPQVFLRHWKRYGKEDAMGNVIPIQTAFAGSSGSNKMTDIDPRINMTYVYYSYRTIKNDDNGNFSKYKGEQTVYPNPTTTSDSEWYFIPIKKHYYPNYNGNGTCNIVMYRYAELLLLLAEACNELDKPEEALDYMDMVLRRAKKYRQGGMMTSKSTNKWTSGTTPLIYGNIYSDPLATVVDDPDDSRQPHLLKPRYLAGKDNLTNKDTLRLRIDEERLFELIGESGEEGFDFRRHGFKHMEEIITYNNKLIANIQKTVAKGGYDIPKSSKMWKNEVYTYDVTDEKFMARALYYQLPLQETSTNVAIVEDSDTYGY